MILITKGSKYKIKELSPGDIAAITRLQPPGWNDITLVFQKFLGKSYFNAFKLVSGNQIIGIGEVIILSESAWIGNIIVDSSYRGRGFGKTLTEYLINFCLAGSSLRILLLATDEAVGLYQNLGFKRDSLYNFYHLKNFKMPVSQSTPFISLPITKSKISEIIELDQIAYGENRSRLIQDFLTDGSCILDENNGRLLAYYLPHLGDGLIVSKNVESGFALMHRRILDGRDYFVVPESNIKAKEFLLRSGFVLYRKATLMHYGEKPIFKPNMIYSRIGGYLG